MFSVFSYWNHSRFSRAVILEIVTGNFHRRFIHEWKFSFFPDWWKNDWKIQTRECNALQNCISFSFLKATLVCELYAHDRFDHSQQNQTVSYRSEWVHYSKSSELDVTVKNWALSISDFSFLEVLQNLERLNETSNAEIAVSYCAVLGKALKL